MLRLKISLLSLSLLALACGGGESTPSGEAPDVSTQGSEAAAPAAPKPAAQATAPTGAPTAAAPSAAPDPQAVSCLDLVSRSRFQEAIAPCTAAVAANPHDAELKAALDKAKAQAAGVANAKAAAGATAQGAANEAVDAAKSKADSATQSAADKLKY
jgi:hypothetical protein